MLKHLYPAYLIISIEPILVQNNLEEIYALAKNHGYNKKIKYEIKTGFQWNIIKQQTLNIDMFSSKQIIQLQLPNKISSQDAKQILSIVPKQLDNYLLILTIDKLSSTQPAWCQEIKRHGQVINCKLPNNNQFIKFIQQQFNQKLRYNLTIAQANLLNNAYQGNITALLMLIDKIKFCEIDLNSHFNLIIEENSLQTIFNLSSYVLKGNLEQSLATLYNLQKHKIEPMLIVWALAKEVRQLLTICSKEPNLAEISINTISKYTNWLSYQRDIYLALKRLNYSTLSFCLQKLHHIDCLIKNSDSSAIWDQLLDICILMVNPATNSNKVFMATEENIL